MSQAYPLTARQYRHMQSLCRHGDLEKAVRYPDCEEIRTRRHSGQTVPDIHAEMGLGVHRAAVWYHATGRCAHYDGVPPAPSKSPVTWVRCRAMRQLAHAGVPRAEIVERAPVEMHPVSLGLHIRGDCSHDLDVPGVSRDFVTPGECESWRRAALDGASANGLARESGRDYAGVRRHLIGECSHDVETQPLAYSGSAWVIDTDADESEEDEIEPISTVSFRLCDEWREAVSSGLPPEELAEDCDHSVDRITEHVEGDCGHGFQSEVAPVRYNGVEWVSTVFRTESRQVRNASRRGATFDG